MLLPHGTTVAVVDGEKIHIYRNAGTETGLKLSSLPPLAMPKGGNKGGDPGHHSSSANPDDSRVAEDGFAAAAAEALNKEALAGAIDKIFIIATPKTLGELRKHYSKALQAKLLGELAKDLTAHPLADIEAALAKA